MIFKLIVFFIVYLLVVVAHFAKFSHCFMFNLTVSLDGTGNFNKISDAIAAAPNFSTTRFYIHIKPGTYNERIEIPTQKTFIALIGDDASKTIIINNRSNGTGFSTNASGTLSVYGRNFMAKFLTFQNSARSNMGPGRAVLDEANYTTYYRCVFLGYQDTLYAGAKPQFFKECDIYGSVDFIFGNGLVVFQDCNIYARSSTKENVVTAQSRLNNNSDDKRGFIFQNCRVTVSPERALSRKKVTTFLGRPWRVYSTVVFINSYMDNVVEPKGWKKWSKEKPVNLLYYAEYNNTGPGADTSQRVDWPGYHVLHNPADVANFTLQNCIHGTDWLPETGIPFRTGF